MLEAIVSYDEEFQGRAPYIHGLTAFRTSYWAQKHIRPRQDADHGGGERRTANRKLAAQRPDPLRRNNQSGMVPVVMRMNRMLPLCDDHRFACSPRDLYSSVFIEV
jgi:hypothetical protein